ncbi:MAG: hypothetical protein ACR2J7_03675 [Luteimonas sp.]
MTYLAAVLFLPWFLILGTLFWLFSREPRTAPRRAFDSDRAFREASHAERPSPAKEPVGAVAIVQLDEVAGLREAGGAQALARLLA